MLLDDGTAAFVCARCRDDRACLTEQAEAESRFLDYREQRDWLKAERGWYGGWPVAR